MSLSPKTKNTIAKTFLWVLGFVLTLSVFWRYILQGFDLNKKEPSEWSTTDTYLTIIAFIFLVGASQFTNIVKAITSKIGTISFDKNKDEKCEHESNLDSEDVKEPPYPKKES